MINKNKGIATIAILGIILGVLIVGGGAYYIGENKGENKKVENLVVNIEDSLPVEEEQNTNTDSQVVSDCDSNSKPSIRVLSPNGGEVYKAGDKITVKWNSCNILNTHKVSIALMYADGEFQGAPPSIDLSTSTINDGIEIFDLKINDSGLFTIFMKDNDLPNGSTNAWSKKFTINSATNDVSTANWKTYTNKVLGVEFNYPPTVSVEETKLGRTDLKSGEVIVRLPFITHYDAWTSKIFNIVTYNDSCKDYLPNSVSQKNVINGISYIIVDPEWGATSGMSTISKWKKYFYESPTKCYIISETISGLGNNERPSTATFPSDVDKFLESELVDLDKIMSSVKIF